MPGDGAEGQDPRQYDPGDLTAREREKASATMDGPAAAECPVSRPAAQFTPEGRRCTRLLLELHQISSDLGTEEFDALIEQIARTQAALREALSRMPLVRGI